MKLKLNGEILESKYEQTLNDLAFDLMDIRCEIANYGVAVKDMLQVIDNTLFCKEVIEKQGIKAFHYMVDSDDNFAKSFGCAMYKAQKDPAALEELRQSYIYTADAALEGFFQTAWEKIKAFFRTIWNWITKLFSSGNEKKADDLIAQAKQDIADMSGTAPAEGEGGGAAATASGAPTSLPAPKDVAITPKKTGFFKRIAGLFHKSNKTATQAVNAESKGQNASAAQPATPGAATTTAATPAPTAAGSTQQSNIKRLTELDPSKLFDGVVPVGSLNDFMDIIEKLAKAATAMVTPLSKAADSLRSAKSGSVIASAMQMLESAVDLYNKACPDTQAIMKVSNSCVKPDANGNVTLDKMGISSFQDVAKFVDFAAAVKNVTHSPAVVKAGKDIQAISKKCETAQISGDQKTAAAMMSAFQSITTACTTLSDTLAGVRSQYENYFAPLAKSMTGAYKAAAKK